MAAGFVVTKDSIYWSKKSDLHADIIEEFDLKEDGLVCVEIAAPNDDYTLSFAKWRFRLKQVVFGGRMPEWFEARKVERRCRKCLKLWRKYKVVMPGQSRIVKAGQHVAAVYGLVQAVRGGTVEKISGGTVQKVFSGTIKQLDSGKIEKLYSGSIEKIFGGAVGKILGGRIEEMWGGAVDEVWGGIVEKVFDGRVGKVIGGTVISYTHLLPEILKSPQAVLVDRTGDKAECFVGKEELTEI